MGRRGQIALLGGFLGIVLLLWVSAASSEPMFQPVDLAFTLKLPQAERDRIGVPEIGGDKALPPGRYTSTPWYQNPNTLATYVFTALIVLGYGAGLVGGLGEFAKYRRLTRPRDERWQRDVVPDLLVEHVRTGQSRLREGTARNAIVAVWAALEDGATAVGLEPGAAETAQEFAERAFLPWLPDTAPLTQLAAMYRRARFSRTAEVGEADRERAGELLEDVLAQLRRHAQEVPRAA